MIRRLAAIVVLGGTFVIGGSAFADIIVVEGKVSEDDCAEQKADEEKGDTETTTTDTSSAPVSSASSTDTNTGENEEAPAPVDPCADPDEDENAMESFDDEDLACEDIGQGVELCTKDEAEVVMGCSAASSGSAPVWFFMLGLALLIGWRRPRKSLG